MHPRHAERLVVGGALGAIALALAGCANLGELTCSGACSDASTEAGPTTEGGAPEIACGDAGACDPTSQQCCIASNGSPGCVPISGCNGGSDLFCDDPRQCPNGGTCWVCVTTQGFQGTSCNYQGDIVGDWGCSASTALPLCHESSQCSGGKTCKPYDTGGGPTWLYACQ